MNIDETWIITNPLFVGSLNLQEPLYKKHLTTWHRNHIPGQLKRPRQLNNIRVGRREMLSCLQCTLEEDDRVSEVINASGDMTVDATRAVPIFEPQLHLHCGLLGVGHHRIGDLNVAAGA
jgi:hypothetical protein